MANDQKWEVTWHVGSIHNSCVCRSGVQLEALIKTLVGKVDGFTVKNIFSCGCLMRETVYDGQGNVTKDWNACGGV